MSGKFVLFLVLFLSLFAPTHVMAADEPVRMDSHGDPLPPHALARLGSVRYLHGDQIDCLAYSPDGKLLASGGSDKCIVLWDTQSGRQVRSLKGPGGSVDVLAFSPDGKLLASSCGLCSNTPPDLCLWNVATGKLLFKFPDTKEFADVVAFFPDGKTLVSAYSTGSVRLWDTQIGKLIGAWSCGDGKRDASNFAIAPNGKVLAAVGSEGKIRLWDLETGKALQSETKTTGNSYHLAFSPDSAFLAEACDEGIHLYRVSTLAKVQHFAKEERVFRPAFSQDGKTLVTEGMSSPICIWDVTSGKQIRRFSEQSEQARSIALSPDGKTVASVGELGHRIIQIWDARNGTVRSPSGRQPGRMEQAAFLADGATVVATMGRGPLNNAQVVVWPWATGKESHPVPLPRRSWNCLLSSDRSTLAVGTEDGIMLLELPNGREILRLPGSEIGNVDNSVVDISADRKRAIVGCLECFVVLDLTTKKVLHRFDSVPLSWRGFSPDGRKLSFQLAGKTTLCVWDLDRNQEEWQCEGEKQPGDKVCRLAYSPDGRMFVTQSAKGTVRLREAATGRKRLTLPGIFDSSDNHSIAFSANARMLAIGCGDGTVRLYDVRDGKQLHVFAGHLDSVTSVDFSPDGSRLVSGSADRTALVWEIPMACRARKPELVKLALEEGDKLWQTLTNADAEKAYTALQRLAASPAETVSLCRMRLLETPMTSPEQIQRWIVQLDNDEFAVREQGSQHLERIGREAEVAFEKALQADCSLEMRTRIEALLETLKSNQLPIGVLRGVELLEQIGTAEATDVLQQLEKKTGDTAVTDDVRRSLLRLAAKPKAP